MKTEQVKAGAIQVGDTLVGNSGVTMRVDSLYMTPGKIDLYSNYFCMSFKTSDTVTRISK